MRGIDGLLLLIIMLMFFILILAFLKNNNTSFPNAHLVLMGTDLIKLNIVDTAQAGGMLITLITFLFARSQFVFGSFPVLVYRIYKVNSIVSISPGNTGSTDAREVYAIDLVNVGKGLGIVKNAKYWIEFKENIEKEYTFPLWCEDRQGVYKSRNRYIYDIDGAEKFLLKNGFKDGADYDALHFGEWTAISPGETRRILVMGIELGGSLAAFDLSIEYESVLGDKSRREIFMIPRRQFSKTMPKRKDSQSFVERWVGGGR